MATYKKFVIIGGGGGNEIENKLMVFDASNPGDIPGNMLRKMVCEESTGKDVANFIDMAHVSIPLIFIFLESERDGCLHGSTYSCIQTNSTNWFPRAAAQILD